MSEVVRERTERTWRIGALAREAGVTVRTLHHYDAIGLVRPSTRTTGGHRVYSTTDVDRLYAVVVLRRMGLAIADIVDRLERAGDSTDVDLRAVAQLQCEQLDAELASLGALRHRIDAVATHGADDPVDLIKATRALHGDGFAVRRVLALLPYDDVLDAQQRLVDMFGFEPGRVARNPDGTVVHAAVLAGNGFVHLHPPTDDVRPPGATGIGSAMVVAEITDVDRHSARARERGAHITYGPLDTSYGVREYGARDHAGHHWSFQSPVIEHREDRT